MNVQLNTFVIPTTALIIMVTLLIFYPIRKNRQLKKWGKLLYGVNSRSNKFFIIILCLAPLLVALLYIRNLGFLQNLILSLCGVLAIELVIRDLLLRKRCGVYENALVADGRILLKKEFVHLPTLEYETTQEYIKEKQEDAYASDALETAAKVIQIVTENKGTIYVGFETAQERSEVVKIIRTWTNQ